MNRKECSLLPEHMSTENQDLNIYVRDDLYETKQHGKPDYPIAIYHVDSQDMQLELIYWHWHEEFEVEVITSGSAHFLVADQDFLLSAGDCLLLNQNVLHRVKPHKDFDCSYSSIVFHPSLILDTSNPQVCAKYLEPIAKHPTLKYYVLRSSDPDAQPMIHLLKNIIQENKQKDYTYELMTKSYVCELWARALQGVLKRTNAHSRIENSQAVLDEERIKGILKFIAAHYHESVSLEELAASVHISKSECCRCFKRRLQITPFEYLIKYRIFSAAISIVQATGTVSFSDIATKSGFNSSSYFNKMFRKYLGCTPTQFLKKTGGDFHNIPIVLEEHLPLRDTMMLNELIAKKRPDIF